jgi:endonuclease YncB( thermonuclease family)
MVKKKTGNRKLIAAATMAIVAGTAAVALPYYIGEKVVKVFDGDSFQIGLKQTIRLNRVNAPEMGLCFGQEAKEALSKMILNKKVVLREPITDMYGRIRALVYVNSVNVNTYMIRNGYAVGTAASDNAEVKAIREAMDYARANRIGIYSERCSPTKPANSKCNIKGNVNMGEGGRLIYTRPDCMSYNLSKVLLYEGDRWFCSEAEAIKAGFVKSAGCK